MFIRWGRKTCPGRSRIVYTGEYVLREGLILIVNVSIFVYHVKHSVLIMSFRYRAIKTTAILLLLMMMMMMMMMTTTTTTTTMMMMMMMMMMILN